MPEILPFLYHRIEQARGQIKILKDRVCVFHELLREAENEPQRSEILLQKAMAASDLNPLVLTKVLPESSPNYDAWSLRGLSYVTGKKYFPDKHGARDYQYENNYMVFHFRDRNIAEKFIQKMTLCGDNSWKYIGHVRDLLDE